MEISVWYGWCLCAQLSTKNGISIFFLPYQTGMVGIYVHGYSGYFVLVFPHINAVIFKSITPFEVEIHSKGFKFRCYNDVLSLFLCVSLVIGH